MIVDCIRLAPSKKWSSFFDYIIISPSPPHPSLFPPPARNYYWFMIEKIPIFSGWLCKGSCRPINCNCISILKRCVEISVHCLRGHDRFIISAPVPVCKWATPINLQPLCRWAVCKSPAPGRERGGSELKEWPNRADLDEMGMLRFSNLVFRWSFQCRCGAAAPRRGFGNRAADPGVAEPGLPFPRKARAHVASASSAGVLRSSSRAIPSARLINQHRHG